MIVVTVEQLEKLGAKKENCIKYVDYLNKYMNKYEIYTKERICHFLSQVYVESACLSTVKENLNYKAETLMKVWPKRFPTLESTNGFVMNPNALADKVYDNRIGNLLGEGKKYIGRGLKQVTGKENYTNLSKDLELDAVNKPEILELPEFAVLSAIWFWNKNKLNDISTENNVEQITKRVNGGTIGLSERIKFYNKAKGIFL